MSIIESALLKNKKEKNAQNGEQIVDKASSSREGFSNSNIRHNTESSRASGISAMAQRKVFSKQELQNRGLINVDQSNSKLVNEYRNLRTKLLTFSDKKNFVTLITSAVPEYDASLVAANIASTFALDSGKTSLIINAESGNTNLDDVFDIEPECGLVDFIQSDKMMIDKIIHQTPIPRLRYVPLGRQAEGSPEHFMNVRMKKTMENLISRYSDRFLFINAPSIESSADTRILLSMCHQVLLVVPYGACSEEQVLQASEDIGTQKLAGVILDGF